MTAESLSLWDWLRTYVDPAHKALTPEIARVASLHCYAEGLLAGTTSVMDMWRYMEGSAAVAADLGIRATLVPYVADAEGYDYFESIASNRKLLEAVADDRSGTDGRVRAWVGLEHLLYCTPECFAEAVRFAFRWLKLVVEPGGVVGLAALLAGRLQAGDGAVGVVLSGGNVDPELYGRLIKG